jgi:hypothetical protein
VAQTHGVKSVSRQSRGNSGYFDYQRHIVRVEFPRIGRPHKETGTYRGHDPLDLVTPAIHVECFSALCEEAYRIWNDDDARILEEYYKELFF